MLEYEEVPELSESELEFMIREHPHLIEPGLRYVASQRKAGRGPLDLLLIDSGNALVVVELKVASSDEMLFQGLDYFDYIYSNLERLALAYEIKGFKIDPYQEPRIMLIAPDFSQSLINRCKWLKSRIDLYRFRYLTVKKEGQELGKIIDFIPVEIPPIPEREEVYTRPKILGYITLDDVRKTANDFLNEIEKWEGVKIDAVKSALSIKIKKDVFVYLYPIRDGFHINGYLSGHEWQHLATVKSPEDLKAAVSAAKQAYDNIRQN
jgi:hypothetical protein